MMLFLFVSAALLINSVAVADSCDDSFLLPLDKPSPSPILTVASINAILIQHNNARRSVNPPAKTMPMLKWNQKLADFAQEYMSTCVGMVHSTSAMRSNATRFGYSYIGENLAAGTSSTSLGLANGGATSTKLWNDEKADWTFPKTCAPGKVCGHYTQVIWAKTLEVGCGYAFCPSQTMRNFWSCTYGPGGNFNNEDEYVTGTPVDPCQQSSGLTPYPSSPPYTTPPPGSVSTPPPAGPSPAATPPPSSPPAGGSATTTRSASGSGTTTAALRTGAAAATSTSAPRTAPPMFRTNVKLGGNFFGNLFSNGQPMDVLVTTTKTDLALLLGITSDRVNTYGYSIGSLLFTADVYPSSSSSSSSSSASEVTAFRTKLASPASMTAASWPITDQLYNGTTGGSDRLTVQSIAEASVVGAPATTASPRTTTGAPSSVAAALCGASCGGFIASVLFAVAFVGAVVAAIVCAHRRRQQRLMLAAQQKAASGYSYSHEPTSVVNPL